MITAWKVSGLSHSPAIIASRPASMRLAMAISPSRDSNSTEPISRKYMRTGSSVRSGRLFFLGGGERLRLGLDHLAAGVVVIVVVGFVGRLLALFVALDVLGLDHVGVRHLGQHGERVLDRLGR